MLAMQLEKRVTLEARLENLQALRDFVAQACQESGGDEAACNMLELAADEACANVVMHGYRDMEPGPIEVIFRFDGETAAVTIVDFARPFSPDDAPAPDLDSPWENRRVGGLGWHLIRQTMDGVEYAANPQGGNRLTLRKRLRAAPPA